MPRCHASPQLCPLPLGRPGYWSPPCRGGVAGRGAPTRVAALVVAARARRGGSTRVVACAAPGRRRSDARPEGLDADDRWRPRAARPAWGCSPGGPGHLVQRAAGRAVRHATVQRRGCRPLDRRDGGHIAGVARLRRAVASHQVLLEGRGANSMAAVGRRGSRGVHCRGGLAMISLLTALSILSLAVQNPETASLRALAREGPDSALVERVRQRNDEARKLLSQLRTVAGGGEDSAQAAFPVAGRAARACAASWSATFVARA